MLVIARVRVWLKEKDERGISTYKPGNLQELWDYVMAHHKDWDGSGCQVVYATHRDMREDVSLFVSGKDMSTISDFVIDNVADLSYVRSIRLIGLLNPRFFPMPKGIFEEMARFTVSVSCEPRALEEVFDTLSRYKPKDFLVPNYIAYTLAGASGDIFVSYSAKGETTLRGFVENYVRSLDGVTNARITRISKTKRLVSIQEWKFLFEEYVPENPIEVERVNDYEEDQISAC